jgi:hypothetical protein
LHGTITKTQPFGALSEQLNPLALAISLDCGFVARAFAGASGLPALKEIIKEAVDHKGFSLIDILQNCISFNKVNTFHWYKERVYALEGDYDPYDRIEAFRSRLDFFLKTCGLKALIFIREFELREILRLNSTYPLKWTPSQGQLSPKLRCASFCLLTELFMLPFGQLPLPNIPQQVFFLRTTDVVVQSCKTQNIPSARQSIPLLFQTLREIFFRTSLIAINVL